ncbi:MAG: thiamine pyrophosphate-binding protein, partial [Propionicimonas sp.]
EELSGPRVAATVAAAVGSGLWLLGSSNPIRDADLAPILDQPGEVFANRGLAGIDGTLATAFGIALARSRPLTVLCGDLTFLHDAGALAIGPGEPIPDVRVVVADDSGGSIFSTLEYGQERFSNVFERVFATDPGVDVAALARGYGVAARRVESAEALADALASPVRGIEVVAASVDREHRRRLDEELKACAS